MLKFCERFNTPCEVVEEAIYEIDLVENGCKASFDCKLDCKGCIYRRYLDVSYQDLGESLWSDEDR